MLSTLSLLDGVRNFRTPFLFIACQIKLLIVPPPEMELPASPSTETSPSAETLLPPRASRSLRPTRPPPPPRPLVSRDTLWRLLLLVPVAGVAWLLGQSPSDTLPEDAGGPSIEAEGVRHFLLQENGKKLCEGSARRVTIGPDQSLLAEDVHGSTLFQDGQPALRLSAKRVRINQRSGDILAFGGVQAGGSEFALQASEARWKRGSAQLLWPQRSHASWRGVQFVTAGAFYDARHRKLVCPQAMHAFVPNRVDLQAASAVANLPARRMSLNGGITLIFRPDAKGAALPAIPKS